MLIGAAAFMLSDAILAVNKFLLPFAGAKYAVMVTYYFAQSSLALSCNPSNSNKSIARRH